MGRSEHEDSTAEGYDRWAPCYDDRDPSTWLDEPFVLTHLRLCSGCLILDLGCGTGRYLRLLRSSSCRIVGVDLSRHMLARARHTIADRTDVALVQASVTSLPFRPGLFDRVISGLVIDHVASAEDLFTEIATVLRPNGRAVIAAVHPEMQRITGSDIEVATSDQNPIRIPGHVHEVPHLLAAAGHAGLTMTAMEEPRVTAAMLHYRPAWSRKLDSPALLLLALKKQKAAVLVT